jgi:hypothetical protein
MYDSQTVTTITGKVVSVDRIAPMKGMSYGVHMIVKTAKEEISVHCGVAGDDGGSHGHGFAASSTV